MYICMYIYMYIYTYTYIYMYIHTHRDRDRDRDRHRHRHTRHLLAEVGGVDIERVTQFYVHAVYTWRSKLD